MTKAKLNLVFNTIFGLLFIYSVFLIWELPQPYGIISVGILIVGLLFNFFRSTKIKFPIFFLMIISSSFVLFMGTTFVLDNIQKRKKFDLDTEVYFEKGNFDNALKRARKLNKPIFIDFYTAWCGSCLQFSRNVLTNKNVGNAMNKSFVNLKYDAEKSEGKVLAKKFNVSSYPTLLIVSADGKILEVIGNNWLPTEKDMIEVAEKYFLHNKDSVEKSNSHQHGFVASGADVSD